MQLVLEQGQVGEIYNVGAGNETPNRVMVDLLLQLTDRGEDLVEYVEDRLGHDRRYSVDISKVTALGWSRRRSFEEALAETVDWYRANEAWWGPLEGRSRRHVTRASAGSSSPGGRARSAPSWPPCSPPPAGR